MSDNRKIQIKVDDLKWIAQTLHQGYHHNPKEETVTFTKCPRSICMFIVVLLVKGEVELL